MPRALTRRSIREGFAAKPIGRRLLEAIVEAGLQAPSSKNAQPWCLHIVDSRETLGRLADAVEAAKGADRYVPIDPATGGPRRWKSTVVESAEVLRSVTVGIFVENRGEFSGGRRTVERASQSALPSALVGYGLEMAGIGAAIQGMWLTAAAHGIAGVFMGDVAVAEDVIADELQIRGDLIGVLALGYSDAEPVPKEIMSDRAFWHA